LDLKKHIIASGVQSWNRNNAVIKEGGTEKMGKGKNFSLFIPVKFPF
jgi:hypothetical protein